MALRNYWREPETSVVHILQDKISVPTDLKPYIQRERLLSTLRESLNCCAATIVNGRSGTGKTLLALDFARASGRPVAWYKVDAPDSDLNVFFQYLCASVRRQRPGFGEQTRARLGELHGIEDVPLLVEYFVYELLEREEPLLLVIDDLHLVYDAEWVVPFFRRLLPLLPREVHVMLLGRSLPPAPLWRMRSKQTLRVIEEAELAFTVPESQRLFACYGLAGERACRAWEQTRGRAATLDEQARTLAAMQTTTPPEESRASRRLRLVKGYLQNSSFETA
ncbi:MAG TPA: AAA family ATPase [Pyrinomonadaceae bacterium]|jgi:ATP/maltotriose-dependent transcriptional regulator MalT|nr:AAA family ATPase [Pyrinomonadaceae bacterium]